MREVMASDLCLRRSLWCRQWIRRSGPRAMLIQCDALHSHDLFSKHNLVLFNYLTINANNLFCRSPIIS